MTGDQAERTVIALERIGTGLLRLAAAHERLSEKPPRRPPVVRPPDLDEGFPTTQPVRLSWPWRRRNSKET